MASRFPTLPGAGTNEPANKYDRLLQNDDLTQVGGAVLQDRDPAKARKARQLGRDLGVPPRAVEMDFDTWNSTWVQRRAMEAARKDPAGIGRWLSNPDNAAIAKDDVDTLGRISEIIGKSTSFGDSVKRNNLGETALGTSVIPALPSQMPFDELANRARSRTPERDVAGNLGLLLAPAPTIGAMLGEDLDENAIGLGSSVVGTVLGTGLGASRYVADAFGYEGGDRYFSERTRELEEFRQRTTPQFETSTAQSVYSGVESFVNLGAMLAAGGPAGVLPLFGATTGLQDYNRFRERGATPNQALAGGVGTGAIEVLTEMIPTGFLLNRFGKMGAGDFIKGLFGRELPTELLATVGQSAVDVAVPGSGRTWEDYRKDLPAELLDTTIATMTMVGLTGAINSTVRKLRPESEDMRRAAEGIASAQLLDNLMAEAERSEMRKGDPESFKRFVEERTEGTPVQNLYVPVEALSEYMQSEGFEDNGFFTAYQEQIAEAQATQGDVVIPVADAAARLAGTPAWEALRERVRVQPGGLSQREAEERRDEILKSLEERGAEIAAEAAEDTEQSTAVAQVYLDTKNRLLSIGVPEREADANAQLWAASRETWARNMGVSIEKIQEMRSVAFRDAETGVTAGARRELAQEELPWDTEDYNIFSEEGASIEYAVYNDEIQIVDIETEPAQRGQGAARAILTRLIKAADERQLSIQLVASPQEDTTTSDRLVAFYRSLGFIETGETSGDQQEPVMVRLPVEPDEMEDLDALDRLADLVRATPVVPREVFQDDEIVAQALDIADPTAPLADLPTRVKVDGEVRTFGPFAPARRAAARYVAEIGLPYNPPRDYVHVDPARATRIAQAFEEMEHNPEDPEVKRAYRAMIDETILQWRMIKETGLQIEFIEGDDPYGNPRNAIIDVTENNHLWVYPTDAGFGGSASADVDISGNPLLEIVPGEKIGGRPVRANDLFRIVHDYFGHIKEGVGFRADGEENAWRIHSAMYSPLARRAMTTETRGQNSWVNFGPFGETNRTASGADTQYAPQKIGLLPQWVVEEGSGQQPRTLFQDVIPTAGWTPERISGLIADYGYSMNDDSKAYATMMSPDQFLGLTVNPAGREMVEQRVDTLPEYRGGELSEQQLGVSLPIHITVDFMQKFGQVIGHEGRHRMTMLKRAGIQQVPVVVRIANGKASEDRDVTHFKPQRSRSTPMESGDTPTDVGPLMPINWKNRDRLEELGNPARVMFQFGEGKVFYSALEKAIEANKTTRAPADQWKATLSKAPGVKREELEWSGLLDWLEMQTGPIERENLLRVVRDGGIIVDELVLSSSVEDDLEAFRDDEVLEGMSDDEIREILERDNELGVQFASWSSDPNNPTYRELLITLPPAEGGNPKRAPSTHWDQEGVVAHARFMEKTDADGKRVLFIEEVQSDWHQKGRDEGYEVTLSAEEMAARDAFLAAAIQRSRETGAAIVAKAEELLPQWFAALSSEVNERGVQMRQHYQRFQDESTGASTRASIAEQLLIETGMASLAEEVLLADRRAALAVDEARQAASRRTEGFIPEAPFKSTWPALVMKRMIRWAVDHGYERIAWTTGEEQAERYNLSQATGGIGIARADDEYIVRFENKDAESTLFQQSGRAHRYEAGGVYLSKEQVTEFFGRDLGGRMLEKADALPESGPKQWVDFRGEDARIGGEGMKAFYDRNLTNITNDIIKRYGVKVGKIRVPQPRMNEMAATPAALRADADALSTVDDRRAEALYARANEIDADIRVSRLNPGFDITPKLAEAAAGGFPLFQNRETGPRGSASFYGDGSTVINLFAARNKSTLVHEMSHVWLEELRFFAGQENAPEQVKADWQRVQDWFVQAGVAIGPDGEIPTAAHELFARSGERYLMEGKAPSAGLQGVFNTFRAWMLRIYQVVQNLKAPITPEIREVFDRLLATQDEIDAQRRQQHVQPLFKTAEEAGMTEAEFAAYQETVEGARSEAYDVLLFKTMEAIRRRENQKMRDQRANVRANVAAEINSRPEFIALHLLRTGRWLGDPDREPMKIKLNTGWLIDTYGEDVLDRLPRGLPIHRGDGVEGDQVAEIVGLASGDQLVQALTMMRAASDELRANGEPRSMRDKMIADETDRIMADRHGDVMTDGSIEEEAIAALNTARQGEIIAGEARQLAKRKSALGTPTPYQIAREWARRKIEAGRVQETVSRAALQRYTRAAAKAARLAEKAILEENTDEAFRQKQAQLLNHALLAEAKVAADEVDAIVARLNKFAKRAAMKSVDQDYMDRIHMLLEKYDFRPRSQRSVDEAEGFAAWVADQQSKGFEVHVPPRLQQRGEHYSRTSVEELRGLNDLISSLIHLGRTKQKLRDAQGERDFKEFRDEVLARIDQLSRRKLPEKPINEEQRAGAGLASELLKIETIIEELDGGKTGPLHDLIILGATRAADLRDTLRERVLQPIAKAYKELGKKQMNRLQEKVTIPELTWNTLNEGDPRQGQTVTITRMELLSIFTNMGNLSNLEKLSKGERWPVATLRAVMDRELTKADLDLAQKLWDQVGLLWPDIVRTERALSGVVPEQVVPTPIETRFGTYQGGYWPVVYDSARSQRAEDLEGKRLDDMFGLKSGVATQKGHTITRTEATGPINLSLERVLFDHVEQAITRIAYSEYARDVLRVIRDKRIRGLIDTKLGPEYRKQVEPWIARQIHEGAVHAKAARWWQKALRQTRINITVAAMGFRISTGIAQTLGLGASAQRIGGLNVARGLKRMALSPKESAEFVMSRSPEMRHRNQNVNREVSEVFAKLNGKHSALTEAQAWAFWHIGMIDRYVVAMPTWLGAHMRGMDEGMTDAEASAYADKAVRLSQGSGREKDLSSWQSPNNDAMRFFTMFYTPFNVMFNAQWQAVRGLKRGDPRPAIGVTFWWLIATTLADAVLSDDVPWDDDDDKTWAGWFGRNVFFGMFAGLPLIRDATNYGERILIGEYATLDTPVSRIITTVEKAARSGYKLYDEGEAPTKPIKQVADLTAVLGGVPVSQAGTTSQFLWDYSQGEVEPETISDWYFGLTRGRVAED